MKKRIILISSLVLVLFIFAIVQITLKVESNKLDDLQEKYENMTVNTKSGELIETLYTYIDDNKFYIKVPSNFKELTLEEIKGKYNGDVPSSVFSNEDTTINVAISLTDNNMKDIRIESYVNYVVSLLNVEMISKEIYKVDNHTVGRLEFISDAVDTKIYNNMICFSYNEKLVIISFNTTIDLKEEWESVGKFIIDSLFFK